MSLVTPEHNAPTVNERFFKPNSFITHLYGYHWSNLRLRRLPS